MILYGFSWGFPRWVGEGGIRPWTHITIVYIMNWILGAKKYYNLDIDYIGIWNERSWDKGYMLALRAAIDAAGLKTKFVGYNAFWDVCNDLAHNPQWTAAIDVIGARSPAANIPVKCSDIEKVF